VTKKRAQENAGGVPTTIAWEELAGVTRELFHDIRNQLNAADLQLVLAAELAAERPEAKQEIERGRQNLTELGRTLARLRRHLALPELQEVTVEAAVVPELLGREGVEWKTTAQVKLDPQWFVDAIGCLEAEHRAAHPGAEADARFRIEAGALILEIGEAGADPPASLLSGTLDYGLRLPASLLMMRAMGMAIDWTHPMQFQIRIPFV